MTLRILVLALCLAAGLLATRLAFAADVTWVRARTLIANEPLANEMRGRAKTVARAFEARCPSALLHVNASGYSESDGGRIGFEILIDGRPLHRHEAWTYRRMQSVPLQVAGVVLDDLVAGAHLLQIRYLAETHTDPNDRIHVSLLEACDLSSVTPTKLARGFSSASP